MNEELVVGSILDTAGNIDCLSTCGSWLFASHFAVVPGKTSMEVGMITAWSTSLGQKFDIKTAGQEYAHRDRIPALCAARFGGEGSEPILFSGSADGLIKAWQFNPSANAFGCLVTLEGHIRGVTSLCFNEGNGMLYSGSSDHTIKVWQLSSQACVYTVMPPMAIMGAGGGLPGAGGAPMGAFSAALAVVGGGAVAAAGGGASEGHAAPIVAIEAVEIEGAQVVISAASDGSIKVWNATTPTTLVAFPMPSVPPEGAGGGHHRRTLTAFSLLHSEAAPSDPFLIAGYSDGTIILRSLQSIQKIDATIHGSRGAGHTAAVRALAPGPQDTLFTGGDDGKISVFKLNVEADPAALAAQQQAAAMADPSAAAGHLMPAAPVAGFYGR
jgi:WD40 repeat protein